jgi:UDP-N-acetylglucosamine:LPS N-acetylglucosamine transferase
MSERKVLILTSDTGGGHTSAARALEAGLNGFAEGATYLVHVAKALEESHLVTERLGAAYNYLLRYRQHYVKYYHWAINRFRPDRSRLVYRLGTRYGRQLVTRFGPNMIVSVHPMLQYFFARLLAELELTDQIPLVTVVTDPCGNSWRGWADDGVRLYLVAHEEARQELLSLGVPDERIRICGMPIHPKFGLVAESAHTIRQEALSGLELDPERFTVFVNAGWAGGGNVPDLFRALLAADLPIQVIFLAGRNDRLRHEAEGRAATARFPVRVLGFSDQMERLMSAADVMVSKLGGLTTFEALACKLPIIGDAVTQMPQEERTASMLERAGAGLMVRRAEEVIPAVRRLATDAASHGALREAAAALGVPDATQRIVREIEQLLPRGVAEPLRGAALPGAAAD